MHIEAKTWIIQPQATEVRRQLMMGGVTSLNTKRAPTVKHWHANQNVSHEEQRTEKDLHHGVNDLLWPHHIGAYMHNQKYVGVIQKYLMDPSLNQHERGHLTQVG